MEEAVGSSSESSRRNVAGSHGTEGTAEPESPAQAPFFPRGAIFFFVLLVLLYGAIWLIIYWLMIARA